VNSFVIFYPEIKIMKKLPIGIQTLEKIRSQDYIYIDKTATALRLIEQGEYYFLSRPRRFGKSLFLDTLRCVFEGKKSLFKDLAIYNQWDWSVTYPVINISFGAGIHKTKESLDKTIIGLLQHNQKRLGVRCKDIKDAKACFAELIEAVYEKYGKVVILVDEYDKPILDNIIDKPIARIMRDRLKNIYSVIKDSDRYIKFVFITGVSKFSKINLFSGLNNLDDITLDKHYATICGYTHYDLETTFKEHLKGVDMLLLKEWYNGYNYQGEPVYNPFNILLFISKGAEDFGNYWWSTGNPSFLLTLLKEKTWHIPDIEKYIASDMMLDSFDVDCIELVPLLWQTGYLTIKEKISDPLGISYRLTVPNREVQISLNSLFISYLTEQTQELRYNQRQLMLALLNADMDSFKESVIALFASIPYNNFTNNSIQNYEGYYASVMYTYLASLGYEVITEDTTNRSRIDLTLKMDKIIYIIELKVVDKPTGKALKQITDQHYYQKYANHSQSVYCIGMEFCKTERNLCLFESLVVIR